MPNSPSRAVPLLILLAAACVLGLAPILVRLTETGPAAAGFWRFLFAMPLLLLLIGRPGGEGIGRPSKWMMLAGLFFALDLSFWHYGIVMTSVANATVLCNLTPVVVTLVGWFVFRERPRPPVHPGPRPGHGRRLRDGGGGQRTAGHQPPARRPVLAVGVALVLGLFPCGEGGPVHAPARCGSRSGPRPSAFRCWAAWRLLLGEDMIPAIGGGLGRLRRHGRHARRGSGRRGLVAGQAAGRHHRRDDPDPADRGRAAQLVDLRRDPDADSGPGRRPGPGRDRPGPVVEPQDRDRDPDANGHRAPKTQRPP